MNTVLYTFIISDKFNLWTYTFPYINMQSTPSIWPQFGLQYNPRINQQTRDAKQSNHRRAIVTFFRVLSLKRILSAYTSQQTLNDAKFAGQRKAAHPQRKRLCKSDRGM